MDIKAFTYHKRAEKYSDCQDCFGINTQNNRIAISDGMTQSIFPQWWAKILVDAFLDNGKIPFDNILPLQNQWQEMVKTEIEKQEIEGKNPWLLRDIFEEGKGAGATICGFEWRKNGWTCQCLGDSCLIKINKDYSIEIITSQKGQFDNHPEYLDSFTDGRGSPITKEGDFNLKALLLVTDPFAELFQIHQEEKEFVKARYEELCKVFSQESYVQLVENWRDQYNMHNDDSTFVLLTNFDSIEVKNKLEITLDTLCLKEQEELISSSIAAEENKNISQSERNSIEEEFRKSAEKLLSLSSVEDRQSHTKLWSFITPYIKPLFDIFRKK